MKVRWFTAALLIPVALFGAASLVDHASATVRVPMPIGAPAVIDAPQESSPGSPGQDAPGAVPPSGGLLPEPTPVEATLPEPRRADEDRDPTAPGPELLQALRGTTESNAAAPSVSFSVPALSRKGLVLTTTGTGTLLLEADGRTMPVRFDPLVPVPATAIVPTGGPQDEIRAAVAAQPAFGRATMADRNGNLITIDLLEASIERVRVRVMPAAVILDLP